MSQEHVRARGCSGYCRLGALIGMFLIIGTGCYSASTGTKIEKDKLTQITKGVTTRAQVEEMFGPPMHIAMMNDGRRMMMYSGSEKSGSIGMAHMIPIVGNVLPSHADDTTHTQSLQVTLDKSGVVQDYQYNEDTTTRKTTSSAFGAHVDSTSTGSDASPSGK